MRLYHFTTLEYGGLALKNRRLKIARIDRLNDPFEFLGWNLKDAEIRRQLKEWKSARNEEYGILCFSRKWSNPLLWGHYADKHQGLVLGFDVPDGDLYNPVKYRRRRLLMPSGRDLIGSDVDDLLLTKFSAWRYESEYRCFCRLSESERDGEHYFEPFSKNLALVEVIVGDQASITRGQLADHLGELCDQVISYKARPAFGSFKVVRNRNDTLWR